MTDDLASLHARFLSGEEGTCTICGATGCHAFATTEEIDATFGSYHDTYHFMWLKPRQDIRDGFICDACVDELVREERAKACYSDMSGPLPGLEREAAAMLAKRRRNDEIC